MRVSPHDHVDKSTSQGAQKAETTNDGRETSRGLGPNGHLHISIFHLSSLLILSVHDSHENDHVDTVISFATTKC